MDQINDQDDFASLWISGKDLERHFLLEGGESPKAGGSAVKDDRRGGAPGLHVAKRRKIGEEAAPVAWPDP